MGTTYFGGNDLRSIGTITAIGLILTGALSALSGSFTNLDVQNTTSAVAIVGQLTATSSARLPTDTQVNSKTICLNDGTNCPVSGSSLTLAQVTANGSSATATLQLYGGVITSTSTVTSTLTVLGGTSMQNTTSTNATATAMFAGLGNFTSLNSNGVMIGGGTINSTPIGGSSPAAGAFTTLSASGLSSLSDVTLANSTGTNATATTLYVSSGAMLPTNTLINSTPVCLSNGTNCPVGGSASLANVTAIGATTTATLSLFGGFLSASSTVTSTLTVVGNTSLQNFTFTSGTSSNWLGFTTASGSSLFASAISVNGSSVCLANGTNCPAAGGTQTLGTVSNNGASATATLQLLGGFIAATGTVTGTLVVVGPTSLANATATSFGVTGVSTSTFSGPVSSTSMKANEIYATKFQGRSDGLTTVMAYNFGTANTGLSGGSASMNFVQQGTSIMQIASQRLNIQTGGILPSTDGTLALGTATARWSQIGVISVTTTNLTVSGSVTTTFAGPVSSTKISVTNLTAAAAGTTNPLCIDANGVGYIGASQICPLSALSAKKDLKPISYGLKELMQIKFFDFKTKSGLDTRIHSGPIADYTNEVMPNLTEWLDGKINGFDYLSFIGVVGRAVQEVERQIQRLESLFAGQQGQINELIKTVQEQQRQIKYLEAKVK